MKRTAWALGIAALACVPAGAQETGGRAADRVLAAFIGCRQQRDPVVRAACYDAALDRLQGQVAARQVVIVDHEQVQQDRRTLFGFAPGHAADAPKPAKPIPTPKAARPPAEDVAEIDSTVVSAQSYGYDQYQIRIATGAVWRTTESGLPAAPRPGTRIHIHRAIMNSYLLRVGGYRAVRAVRVN
jgi:hypothetical protein